MEITKQDLNRTVYVKKDWLGKNIDWYKIDAADMTIGRVAVMVADLLLGKNKAHYMDFWNVGGFVVVTNLAQLRRTGNKGIDKKYHSYSGWKGNVKARFHSDKLDNKYRKRKLDEPVFRAQYEMYDYFKKLFEQKLLIP